MRAYARPLHVAQFRRSVTRNGKKTVEVVYLITSSRSADPATLAAWVRGHWEIENKQGPAFSGWSSGGRWRPTLIPTRPGGAYQARCGTARSRGTVPGQPHLR